MSLIEEYYELNEAEEVLVIWKILQIIFYASAACLGLWCGYTIAILRLKFENKCYLFTSIKIVSENDMNYASVNWESDYWCDYCQYCMVSSFIVATIWATFFLMCGKGGKSMSGLPQPWRIVWPSLIFNFIYFLLALSTAVNIQEGTDLFCLQVDPMKNLQPKSLIKYCTPLEFFIFDDPHITSFQIETVTKTSWGCAISWLILFLISFARIVFVIDFDLYKICVFKIGEMIQNKREEVLKITNYEEPKKVHFGYDNIKIHNDEVEKDVKTLSKEKYLPFQQRTLYYVGNDIRMLNHEKNRKSVLLLDQACKLNKHNIVLKQINKAEPSYCSVNKVPSFQSQHLLQDLSELTPNQFRNLKDSFFIREKIDKFIKKKKKIC